MTPLEVVDIESSDDEGEAVVVVDGGAGGNGSKFPRSGLTSPSSSRGSGTDNVAGGDGGGGFVKQRLECRSFWKAGAFEVVASTKVRQLEGELEHARVHPKFLHSNATSHKWAFGAIAELLDNAVDEIPNGATFVKVDKIVNPQDNSPALVFQDDGGGMDPDHIRKCMSLGYSSKNNNTNGNGFKTSTMRLGADVIVFSRSTRPGQATQSIGLLSYTFLRQTCQDDVIVPMVDFDISNNWAEPIIYSSLDDWTSNLNTIIEWSPFGTKEELMSQFDDIGSHGTRILIYNLWLNDEGIYELSFDDDNEDIRLRDESSDGGLAKINKRTLQLQAHISYRLRYSLRAYASILYLRKLKNFKIILRGKPVEQFDLASDLKHEEVVSYKPNLAVTSVEVVKVSIGFIKDAPDLGVNGFNVYHKNRLIRHFWKVTPDGSSKGRCIVGFLEANFINPAHDKQDFERTSLYIRLEARLKQMDNSLLPSARMQKEFPADPRITGLSASNFQNEMHQSPSMIGVAPFDRNGLRSMEPRNGRTNELRNTTNAHNISAAISDPSRFHNDLGSRTIDQICEENIELFVRCEEHVQKQQELKQTISKLEKDLEETRRKCAQLAAHLESKKKQMLLNQEVGKA
ncbi:MICRORCHIDIA 2-like protein [Drosera capensis]